MSDEIRDVTTITFSGPRFDDAGLELDVLAELPTDLASNFDHYLYGSSGEEK